MGYKEDAAVLRQLGYLWSVSQDELADIVPDDDVFKQAILDIQGKYDLEFAGLLGKHYGELKPQTGEWAPAVSELINVPRHCPIPDVPPPEDVTFAFADPDVQAAVESQQKEAASRGSGSWPYNCWEDYVMHRVVVAVDDSNASQPWLDHLPWIKEQCRINFSWSGLRVDFVPAGERADVRLTFVTRSPGWIGLAEFNNRTCEDEVFCKLRKDYHPNRELMLNLVQHEIGHNCNLQHVAGSYRWLMSPVINDADPDWRENKSWSVLERYFGGTGSPEILKDNPDPVPPPPGPPIAYNGVFIVASDQVRSALAESGDSVQFKIKVDL